MPPPTEAIPRCATLRNVAQRCATQAMQLWSCYFLPKKIGTPPTEAAASDAKQQKCLWQRGIPVFPTRYRLTPRPLRRCRTGQHRRCWATEAMLSNTARHGSTVRNIKNRFVSPRVALVGGPFQNRRVSPIVAYVARCRLCCSVLPLCLGVALVGGPYQYRVASRRFGGRAA